LCHNPGKKEPALPEPEARPASTPAPGDAGGEAVRTSRDIPILSTLAHKIQYPGAKERSLFEHRLDRYFETGGFPEVQTIPQELRVRVLQEYIDVVIF
jgi:hypothetical protein